MKKLADFFFDIFVSTPCKQVEKREPKDLTRSYQQQIDTLHLDRVVVAIPYTNEVKKRLHSLKYEHSSRYVGFFQETLNKLIPDNDNIIIYPPSHLVSKIFRGKNHMARIIGKEKKHRVSTPFVRKYSQHQARLSKSLRQKNIQQSYTLQKGYDDLFSNKTIYIIDDVISTGSTANELAKLLKKAGAKQVEGYFVTSSHKSLAKQEAQVQ